MTAAFRQLAAAFLATLAFALPARAGSLSVDFSDLWWNSPDESESGWGVNIVQQVDTLFLTFFIYGTDNAARWVVAPAMGPTATQPTDGVRFEGDLYQTRGPWFGGPFNPAAVTRDKVGTATITFDAASTATLSYTVNGTSVVKRIKRQTYKVNSAAGSYGGGMLVTASQCGTATDNGQQNFWGALTVTQTASQISFKVDFYTGNNLPALCVFTGNYAQEGRLASVSGGTFTCTVNGANYNKGTFAMTSLDSQMNGLHANFTGKDQYCTYNGRAGGTRLPGG